MKRYPPSEINFPDDMRLPEMEREFVLEIFRRNNYNRKHTALSIGLTVTGLNERLERYGIPIGKLVFDD